MWEAPKRTRRGKEDGREVTKTKRPTIQLINADEARPLKVANIEARRRIQALSDAARTNGQLKESMRRDANNAEIEKGVLKERLQNLGKASTGAPRGL